MRETLDDDGIRLLLEALQPARGAVLGAWIFEGRCGEVDPELWFPPKGQNDAAAKAVCAGCEVREKCLSYALEADEEHGVWGGLSRAERIRLRKRMDAEAEAGRSGEGAA